MRVYGRTLGAPIDPKIWVRSVNDPKHLLDADDSRLQDLGFVSQRGTWHIKDQMDPVAIFKVPADGDYLIGVEDGAPTGAARPGRIMCTAWRSSRCATPSTPTSRFRTATSFRGSRG